MTYKVEKIVPYKDDTANKSVQVERMFNEIADQYDKLNHTLSFGIDYAWRKRGILSLKDVQPNHILDIATGTGDLALDAYKRLHPEMITAIDISEKMMDVGRQKVSRAGLSDKITFLQQDCTALSFDDNTFDAATVAFGVRNFENLEKGLQEVYRVLYSEGKFMILELSVPENFIVKQLYFFYSKIFIPVIGKWISGNKNAYNYLPKSIKAFPQNAELASILQKIGFRNVSYKKLTFGICTLYLATK